MEYLTKKQLDSLDLNGIPEERKYHILELKDSIKLDDESITDFGNNASKKISDFSGEVLKNIKISDFPEIADLMGDLNTQLKKVDCTSLIDKKQGFFGRLFKTNPMEKLLEGVVSNFENVKDSIDAIEAKLEDARYQLKKDMTICEKYTEQSLGYINELDDCIFAGRLKLKEFNRVLKEESYYVDKEDALAIHLLQTKQGAITRLELNIQNLCLIRENAIQNLQKFYLLREGNAAMVEKIRVLIHTTIPLWEQQMLMAYLVVRQKNSVELDKAFSDTTNNLIKMNSKLVKSGAISVAESIQRGTIDIETLKISSQEMKDTIQEINKIALQGKKERENTIKQLGEISEGLNNTILITMEERR